MTDLREHKVAQAVALARRLHATGGGSLEAFEQLRSIVADEVLQVSLLPVIGAAMAKLAGDPARATMERVLRYVRHTFHFDDRIVVAIAMPVLLRLKGKREKPCYLNQGKQDILAQVAGIVRNAAGARRVVMEGRFVTAEDITHATPCELRDYLCAVEVGNPKLVQLGRGIRIDASPHPRWEIVYFVGAVIHDLESVSDFEGDDVQERLAT
jgi:hypothetical protein